MTALVETIFLKIKTPQEHFWMSTPLSPENISQSNPRKRSPNTNRRGVTPSKNISGTKDKIPTILKPYDTIQHLLDMPIFYFESNKYTYADIVMINGDTLNNIEKTDKLHKYIGDDNIIKVQIGTFVTDACPICLEQLGNDLGSVNRVVAAHRAGKTEQGCFKRHLFHKKCLERWMENNNFCPLCRGDISIKRVLSTQCLTSEGVKNVNKYFKF